RRARDDVGDLRFDLGGAQSADDLLPLPVEIGALFQMLDGAAAADGERAAGRLDALQRGGKHGDEVGAILDACGRHPLAGQREGDEDLAGLGVGDAVRLRAKAGYFEGCAHRSLIPPSRNSRLPSPPATGESQTPSARQPAWASSQARSFSAMRGPSAGSLRMPPLPIASRPASNCGFTRNRPLASGAASDNAGGSASISEMKLTSEMTKSGDLPPRCSIVRSRALRSSMAV